MVGVFKECQCYLMLLNRLLAQPRLAAVHLAQARSHNLGLLGLTFVLKPPSSPHSDPVGLRK